MSSAKWRPFWLGLNVLKGTELVLHITFLKTICCSRGSNSQNVLLSGVPDYFYRNKISSGGDLSHYSSASLY